MTTSVIMSNTDGKQDLTGTPVQANGWYGYSDSLHTVSIQVQNFQGRVYLEGSLATTPEEGDWFAIPYQYSDFIQFPAQPAAPTGVLGDTGVVAFSFKANLMWVRARMDRSYMLPSPVDLDDLGKYGVVRKIILSR